MWQVSVATQMVIMLISRSLSMILVKEGISRYLHFPATSSVAKNQGYDQAFTLHLFQISMCKLQIPFALLYSHLYDAFPVIDPQIKHIYTRF